MSRKKFTVLVFVLGVVSILVFIFYAKIANAAVANPRFLNKVYIKWNGDDYVDVNPYDGTYSYEKGSTDCRDTIDVLNFDSKTPQAKISIQTYNTQQDGKKTCTLDKGYPKTISMDGVNVRKILGYKTSDDTIVLFAGAKKRTDSDCIPSSICEHLGIDLINGKPVMHTYVNPPKNEWNSPADKNRYKQLKDGAEVNTPDSTEKYLYVQLDAADPSKGTLFTLRVYFNFAHYDKKVGDIVLANNGKITPLPEESKITSANGGSSTADPGDALQTCEVKLTNPLTWVVCPMINGARDLVAALNSTINDMLTLPTDKLFVTTNEPANQFYDSWSGFRYIAMGLLVIIALIMVLSQAIGVGPFDAYTIRKVLPRLLAAVVLVSLSWPLMKLAVDITNGIGHSVSGLIYGPFKLENGDNPSNLVMLGGLVGALGGGFVFGIFGALAFVATAALSLLSGMATLIFREMLIMFLVVVAPVAIICSILPNTQIVWKKWSDYFLRALIVFPIFSGVIAIGQVFAVIGPTLHDGAVGDLIQFIGYFGPYFMLPKIFAMSGGAVAAVGSVAQKATAGMRGGLSKFRSNKAKQNWADTKASNRFKGTGALSRRASSALQIGAIVGTGRAGIRPSRMASRTRSIRGRESLAQANELLEKSPEMMAVASDDHLLRATRDGRSRAEIEGMLVRSGRFGHAGSASLGAAVSAVESAQRSGSAAAVGVAATLGLSRTGTGYDTHADMFEAISGSAGGDVLLEQAMLGSMRSSSEKARRFDLATGGHVDQAEAMADLRNGTRTREQVNTDMRRASFQAGGVHTLVSGRSAPFAEMITQLGTDFDGAMTSGDTATATEYASQITSLRSAMGSASPDNRAAIMALLTHVGVNPALIRDQTGQPYSTDEQLGIIINQGREDVVSQRTTQEIRTRAGLYDAGGGTTTDAQQRERQQRPPGQP